MKQTLKKIKTLQPCKHHLPSTEKLLNIVTNPKLSEIVAGYGSCADCSCPGYSGSGYTCTTCGHHYTRHW